MIFLFCRFMIKLFIFNAKVPIWLCFLKPCVGLCVTYLYRIEADGRRAHFLPIFWQFLLGYFWQFFKGEFWQFFLENFDSSFWRFWQFFQEEFWHFFLGNFDSSSKENFDSSFLGILTVLNGSFGQFLNQEAQSK